MTRAHWLISIAQSSIWMAGIPDRITFFDAAVVMLTGGYVVRPEAKLARLRRAPVGSP